MKKVLYVLVVCISCLACGREEKGQREDVAKPEFSQKDDGGGVSDSLFNQDRWRAKEGAEYPYRKKMVADLMQDPDFRKLKRKEIIDLLGDPDRINENYLYYKIDEKRLGLFPLHTTTMVIELAGDSSINWIKIHK